MIAVIWQYRVRRSKTGLFRKVYESKGDWAELFALGSGYFGTTLLQIPDTSDNGFMTVDFWNSAQEFERFRVQHADRYSELDAKCGALTIFEQFIGLFEMLPSLP